MSGYGILDYEGMNQAIYRGATSNIVVDTQKMGIGIGVDQNGPSSNLHVVGNTRLEGDINMIHTSNTSSMKVNSNVVTEFPRSKKLIRYPRVALTAASGESSGYQGYYVTESSNATFNPDRTSWKAFNMTFSNADADDTWTNDDGGISDYNGTDNTYNGNINLGTGAVNGEWIKLQLPHKIRLEYMKIWLRGVSDSTRIPEDWILYGSNDNLNWTPLLSITGQGAVIENTYSVNATSVYDYFAVVVTKISGQNNYFRIVELEYFGLPEYDPNAAGMDVKVTSYPNVPNTDWLEVYYDAKESSSYPGTGGTVVDLSGNQNNGTLSGGVGFDSEYKAFTFDGVDDLISGTHGLGTGSIGAHSMSYWLKRTSQVDTYDYHAMIGTGGNTGGQTAIGINSDKILVAHNGGTVTSVNTVITNDTWIHVAVNYNGGTTNRPENHNLYINGIEQSLLGSGSGSAFSLVGNELTLGRFAGGANGIKGSIANFRLFNRALTSDEIYQLYAYQKEYFGHGDLGMTLKAGRLGIGTSEPRATLDVRGDVHISGNLRKTRAQMIRLESGGKRFTASGWQAYVAYGEEWTAYSSNPLYSVSITGDYVDGNHKSINYRIAVQNQRTREVVYFPDTTGWRKYLYIYDNRLDGHGYFGIMSGLIPGDLYKVQLEVEPRSNGTSDDYEWNSIYGTITGLVWD